MLMIRLISFLLFLLTAQGLLADELLHGTVIGTRESVDYDTGQMSYTVNSAACAFDGRLDTYFASYERSQTWVGLDLGTPHVITKVGWSPRNDIFNGQRVLLAVFEGSNRPDFLDAVPLYMVQQFGTVGVVSHADVTVQQAFRYVRYVGPNNVRCNVAEVEFYGHPGEVWVPAPSKGESVSRPAGFFWRPTNLPLITIHTLNRAEPFDKYHDIDCYISVISEGRILADTATFRLRGNASADFPKKPYRIKWDEKHRVLDSPAKAKKWALVSNYGDKTLMRNLLAFDISRRLEMPFTPFAIPVDLMVNGEYRGCYQFTDQVELGKNRIDIEKMDETCDSGEDLTGGYLIEINSYAGGDPVHFTSAHGNPVSVKDPDESEIISAQLRYVTNYFNTMEELLYKVDYTNPDTGYRRRLDLESFLKHFLIGEFSGNTDTYWSLFMFKPRSDARFYVSPVWDFDLAFENDVRTYPVCSRGDWLYRSGGYVMGNMRDFVNRIVVDDAAARDDIADLWRWARIECGVTESEMIALVDDYADELAESQYLNFLRWPILRQRVHQNVQALGSYKAEVEWVRTFIRNRIAWMDSKIGIDLSGVETPRTPQYSNNVSDVYTLDGRRIDLTGDAELPPGIYIRGGRKVVVK